MQIQRFSKDYPRRGQVYIADLDPFFGREIHKKRPVLIISTNDYNQSTPYVVIIPSSSIIPLTITPEMVFISKPKGFDKESVFLPLYIRNIDKDRLIKKIGTLSKNKFQQVEDAVKLILGLELWFLLMISPKLSLRLGQF